MILGSKSWLIVLILVFISRLEAGEIVLNIPIFQAKARIWEFNCSGL